MRVTVSDVDNKIIIFNLWGDSPKYNSTIVTYIDTSNHICSKASKAILLKSVSCKRSLHYQSVSQHTHTHTHTHTHNHAHMHSHTHTTMHTCTHTHTHTHTQPCTHALTHAHTQPCMHALTHTCAYTHTHTHTTHASPCNDLTSVNI